MVRMTSADFLLGLSVIIGVVVIMIVAGIRAVEEIQPKKVDHGMKVIDDHVRDYDYGDDR